MFGILVFFRYFSTGFPKVPYGTKRACTETYWQLLNTLQGISAPHWHTALCIQTVGLTAASPQPYLPNKQVFILFSSSLTLHSQVYVPYPNMFCLISRLRTVYTSLANIYWEYSILSQLRSRIEKKILLHLCIIPIKHDLVSQQNPFSWDFISHYFLLLRYLH